MSGPIRTIEIRLDLGAKQEEALRHKRHNPTESLGDFLRTYPARTPEPLPAEYLKQPLSNFIVFPVTLKSEPAAPPPAQPPSPAAALRVTLDRLYEEERDRAAAGPADFPERLSDGEAVHIAYADKLHEVARYLENDLSVLVVCDKILTEHIDEYVCHLAGRQRVAEDAVAASSRASRGTDLQRALQGAPGPEANLPVLLRNLKPGEVLVLRALDILDSPPLIEALYHSGRGDRKPQLLGFLDPSLQVRKVLLDRFAVRVVITGLERHAAPAPGAAKAHLVSQLITAREAKCFQELDPEGLYKNVVGLNAVQFRNAMRYVGARVQPGSESRDVYDQIRRFKYSTSDEIEIPQVRFKDIGGYERLKRELEHLVNLVAGRVPGLSDDERHELLPRGFVFHGPPGTGKTLFAKAIANEMNATIQMISGPEIMDKYVGQSESNLRHIFATARRNAPSVIFFDEFDSIASQRSNYASDGGTRANNAVVAQLLTELDGFRRDEAVLVIGTTNRISDIDEALLRPARLRPVEIGRPEYPARRSVAEIHARNFGIDELIRAPCRLALPYLGRWGTDRPLPQAFVNALLDEHPPYARRFGEEGRRDAFLRDVRDLIDLLAQAGPIGGRSSEGGPADACLAHVERRLQEITAAHGQEPRPDGAPAGAAEELRELLEVLRQQALRQTGFSADVLWEGTLDLVAEYTDGFNNDEIRAVFQEAKLEYHVEGRLITPRYLGLKIGLIKNRRDEREVTHLTARDRPRR